MQKPLLPSHYYVWFDPPDAKGDEVLHIVSDRRTLKLKGRSFREFSQRVVPLLNGHHSFEDIYAATADVFPEDELRAAFNTLVHQGVLVDGASRLDSVVEQRVAPQMNLFHDLMPGEDLQGKLAAATVAVVGLGGAGSHIALALGAAGVGTIRCIDWLPVTTTDVYLSPFLSTSSIAASRAATIAALIKGAAPEVQALADTRKLEREEEIREAIQGVDLVVCCLDGGRSNSIFKLNRVCLADGIRWIACSLAGAEVVVGPAIHPGTSACYLCYRMRTVACAGNPEDAFAFERFLDRRKTDDSDRHENLVFGAGLVANFVGMEVMKELTGFAEPSLVGRILSIRVTDLTIQKHTVLRKPWCPACFGVTSERSHGE